MKKEKREVGVNVSSGAEKVETVAKKSAAEHGEEKRAASRHSVPKKKTSIVRAETSAKGAAAMGSATDTETRAEKVNALSSDGLAEKESEAAKARVERALQKKQAKNERAEAKVAAKKHRAEAKKAKAKKKKLAAQKRKAVLEEKQRERAHEKANRHAARAQKQAQKQAEKEKARKSATEKRTQKKSERAKRKTPSRKARDNERSGENTRKGYGGWLAAVIALGATTLALGTTVTVGGLEMRKSSQSMVDENRRTMYELTGLIENMDSDLERVRISASPAQQSRILTDVLVQSRLVALDLERMPLTVDGCKNLLVFVNRAAHACEGMLAKLQMGESLSDEDYALLERLYAATQQIRAEWERLTATMTKADWAAFTRKEEGKAFDAIEKMEGWTLEENQLHHRKKTETEGTGMRRNAENEISAVDKIDPARAETLCESYFAGYPVSEYRCVGETVGRGYAAYNVQAFDKDGGQLFAEVSQTDGRLLRFDYYADCVDTNFDYDNAERIAESFLTGLGYADMETVRLRENGSNVDFRFVYTQDGVACYPDAVQIKVCRSRGLVSGFDGVAYVMRHQKQRDVSPKITLAAAKERLYKALSVESARLIVTDTARGERLAYEFLCSYNGENYFVFVDAENGEEIAIVNTRTAE